MRRPQPWTPQPFLPVSSQVYSEIQQFLIYEALLLDHGHMDQWVSLLAQDITFRICNYSGEERIGPNAAELAVSGRKSLFLRIGYQRTHGPMPGTRSGLPTSRRFVSNVSATFAHCRGEYDVISYMRVTHIEGDGRTRSAWSAERRDRLRAIDRSFSISRRELLIDTVEPGISGPPQFL